MNSNQSRRYGGSWRPIAFAFTLASFSATALAAAVGEHVKAQSTTESEDVGRVGSGYTDTATAGSGYTGSEEGAKSSDKIISPDVLAGAQSAISDDGTDRHFDRGYYEEPEQVAMVVPLDGVAYQYDRGYYKDPDEVMVIVRSNAKFAGEDSSTPYRVSFLAD